MSGVDTAALRVWFGWSSRRVGAWRRITIAAKGDRGISSSVVTGDHANASCAELMGPTTATVDPLQPSAVE